MVDLSHSAIRKSETLLREEEQCAREEGYEFGDVLSVNRFRDCHCCGIFGGEGRVSRPLVSVLIYNHNYERFLGDAIDGALRQTYSPIEIIVVDDESTDSSRDVAASYGNKISCVFKVNGGQASAFNTGVKASHGEHFVFPRCG